MTGSTAAFRGDSGDPLLERVHAGDVARVAGFLTAVADKPPGDAAEAEWRMVDTEGAYRHVSVVATNLIDDPRVGGLVLTVRDNDARKRFEEQLRHRAFHDELTGLANRALFYDRAEHALHAAAIRTWRCCSWTSTTSSPSTTGSGTPRATRCCS